MGRSVAKVCCHARREITRVIVGIYPILRAKYLRLSLNNTRRVGAEITHHHSAERPVTRER